MKYALLLAAACTAVTSQADIWQFDLGPQSGGFGINGANERPTVQTPATGREIPDFNSDHTIQYDDSTKQLEIHLGFGSASEVGGTDLSGDFSGIHIHGPADVNSSSSTILYDLEAELVGLDDQENSLFFPVAANNRTALLDITFTLREGIGGFTVAQQQAQLLGSQWYINVHSSVFPTGEIRGQLLAIPEPEHYAAFAGLALLGFAGYRRIKLARA